MNNTTSTIVAGTLAAATAIVTISSSAGNAAAEGTTLSFTLAPRTVSQTYVDEGRPGRSLGDRHLTAISVKTGSIIAGRAVIECVAADGRYQGQTCDVALQLADGTLHFEGVGFHKAVPNVGTGDDTVYAITGGSGAYAGAEGEVSVGLDDHGPVTVTLVP